MINELFYANLNARQEASACDYCAVLFQLQLVMISCERGVAHFAQRLVACWPYRVSLGMIEYMSATKPITKKIKPC